MKMCDKLPYENPRIDTCLRPLIATINADGRYHMIASCCGHGVLQPTIVVKERATGKILEWNHEIPLTKAKRHRYYKKNKKLGIYYIPGIEACL